MAGSLHGAGGPGRTGYGASRVFKAEFAAWLPMRVMGKWTVLKASVVACDVPFLMGKPTLKELGMKMDMTKQHDRVWQPRHSLRALGRRPRGTPGSACFLRRRTLCQLPWDEILRATAKCGGVWYPVSEQESYMAAACTGKDRGVMSRPGKSCSSGLFYAKKIPVEVENMLSAEELRGETFLGWWKQTNCSPDFWIETKEAFYRIHITPRRYDFSPSSWNTVREDLKERLLSQLGAVRTVTRIPCHGVQIAVSETSCWKNGQSMKSEQSLQGNTMWIGRSRFEKAATSNSKATPPPPEGVFHGQLAGRVETQQEGAGGGDVAVRCRGTSEVQGHGEGTTGRQTGGDQRTGGFVEDDSVPAGRRSQERGRDGAREANARRHDEDCEGSGPGPRRDSLPFRYKGWAYDQIFTEYLDWAVRETEMNENSSDDLCRLANWRKDSRASRVVTVREGLPADDPEMTAKKTPPSRSSASRKSWTKVTPKASPRRAGESGSSPTKEEI